MGLSERVVGRISKLGKNHLVPLVSCTWSMILPRIKYLNKEIMVRKYKLYNGDKEQVSQIHSHSSSHGWQVRARTGGVLAHTITMLPGLTQTYGNYPFLDSFYICYPRFHRTCSTLSWAQTHAICSATRAMCRGLQCLAVFLRLKAWPSQRKVLVDL